MGAMLRILFGHPSVTYRKTCTRPSVSKILKNVLKLSRTGNKKTTRRSFLFLNRGGLLTNTEFLNDSTVAVDVL